MGEKGGSEGRGGGGGDIEKGGMGITFNADLTANCLAWLNSEVTLKPDRLLKDARKRKKKIFSVVVARFYLEKCY
jgi:hypothetical protein